MIEQLIYSFLEAWLIALIALIIGRFAGASPPRFPSGIARNLAVFFQVWVITAIAKYAFGYLGHTLQWSEAAQAGFAEFLLPIAAGAYFARQLPLRAAQSSKVTTPEAAPPKKPD